MASSSSKQAQTCEECKLNLPKYNCPACSVRSCSLPCVKAHKQRTGCTGKRRRTDFVPLSQFNDNLLISDYNMLEDVKRITEAAKRTRAKLCPYSYPQYCLPYYLKGLRSAAANRKTKLLFLPSGMSKREKNKSRYDHKKKFIQWTIEWRFHSTDIVLLDHGVHEDRNLHSVVESHLQPTPWNNKLRQFTEVPLSSLNFFVRKYPKGPKSPFRELDIKAPIRQQFSNMAILEYPVIHVFLPTHSYDFEVDKDVILISQAEDCCSNDAPIPFKEEEIEGEGDSISADGQVFDLMKQVNSSARPACQTLHQEDKPLSERASLSRLQGIDFDELGFDFDQGLIDAYSNLIAEVNPDGYLDLEGGISNGVEGSDVQVLEEGEILE